MRPQTDWDAGIFEPIRPKLFAVAYRMLGTVSEAEDMVQDCFLRWMKADRDGIRDPEGWLVRVTTNLCLDHLKSARVRRESYTGEWLPEPVVTDPATDYLERDISTALLLAMERLSPLERAAFILHDIFDYSFEEVSDLLERDNAACRQLAARGRKRLKDSRPRFPIEQDEGERIAQAFFQASRHGDPDSLKHLLAQDVIIYNDGGGKVIAALNPIYGLEKSMRFTLGLARKYADVPIEFLGLCQLNQQPGFITREPDGTLQATSLEITDGKISRVYVTRNPDKLRHLMRQISG